MGTKSTLLEEFYGRRKYNGREKSGSLSRFNWGRAMPELADGSLHRKPILLHDPQSGCASGIYLCRHVAVPLWHQCLLL